MPYPRPIFDAPLAGVPGGRAATMGYVDDAVLFHPRGARATPHTAVSKLRNVTVTADDYEIPNDGSIPADNRMDAAMRDFSDSGGGTFQLPQYLSLTQAPVTTPFNVHLQGSGHREGCVLYQNALDAPAVVMPTSGGRISGFAIDYFGGNPLPGATAVKSTGTNNAMDNVFVRNCWDGLDAVGAGGKFWSFDIRRARGSSIVCRDGVNDNYFVNFVCDAPVDPAFHTTGALKMLNQVEACNFILGSFLGGKIPLLCDANGSVAGQIPAYNTLMSVYFDSALLAGRILKMLDSVLQSCWWSGGRSGPGYPGLEILGGSGLMLPNNRAFNCGAQGILVHPEAVDVSINDANVYDNGQIDHTASGIEFLPGCAHFSATLLKTGNGYAPGIAAGHQQYGLKIGAGCTDYTRFGITNRGNVLGAWTDATSSAATVFA